MVINTLKKLLLPAIIAIISGTILGTVRGLTLQLSVVLILAIFFICSLLFIATNYIIYRFGQKKILWLIRSNRFQEAVRCFKPNIQRYDNSRTTRINADLFEASLAYCNLGKFRKSILCLKGLDWSHLDHPGKLLFYNLLTLNLILLEENLELAEKCLNKVEDRSLLFYSHLELLKNNTTMADWLMQKFLYEEYMEPEPFGLRLLTTMQLINPPEELDNTVIEFLIGYFFYRRQQYKSAHPFLAKATQSFDENFYSHQAAKFKTKIERVTGAETQESNTAGYEQSPTTPKS